MADLISIIVPIYNASIYLQQCLDSILCQTYQELEIILIDDGSTDDSLQICKEYRKKDERIRLIHQENGGSVAARKSGLNIAEGIYIGFVDADDYIEPDMFEELHAAIKEFQVDFVHSGVILNNVKNCYFDEGIVDFSLQDRADYISKNVFEVQTISFALWPKLFRADLVKEAFSRLSNEQSYGEDLLCLCSCLLKCNKFYMLRKAFYHYRIYTGSLSHLNWLDACIEESKLYTHVLKFLKENRIIDLCENSARYHYKQRILQAIIGDRDNGIYGVKYRFPNIERLKGKKIVIYGAGNVGKDFYRQISLMNECEITGWVDKKKHESWNLISIETPEALNDFKYDVLLIAVKKKAIADEIRKEIEQSGNYKNGADILWEEPVYLYD